MQRRPLLAYIGLAYLWTWSTTLPLLLQKRGLVAGPKAAGAVGTASAATTDPL